MHKKGARSLFIVNVLLDNNVPGTFMRTITNTCTRDVGCHIPGLPSSHSNRVGGRSIVVGKVNCELSNLDLRTVLLNN